MRKLSRVITCCLVGVALISLLGCAGKKVLIPPRIDLGSFERIGMIKFKSNAEGNLDQFASQKFLETIQESQPGVRVLELGDEARVLESIERDEFDFRAITEIGRMYNVDGVIIGTMEVTDVKPRVQLSTILTTLSVQADVEAAMTARLYETAGGATMWTNSAEGVETVGHVGMTPSGPHFDASDPEDAYGQLVYGLVYNITRDFRGRWVKQ